MSSAFTCTPTGVATLNLVIVLPHAWSRVRLDGSIPSGVQLKTELKYYMRLYFPGGAGGNWFSHLVYCIGRDDFRPHAGSHYHAALKHPALSIKSHDDYNLSDMKRNDILFAGNCVYDFYVNVVKKFEVIDNGLDESNYSLMIEKLSSTTSYLLHWYDSIQLTEPTIRYELLWNDEQAFVEKLSVELASRGLKQPQNRDLVLAKMAEFKSKNFDARPSFNNNDNIFWLGWCAGYMKHYKVFASYQISDEENKHKFLKHAQELNIIERSMKYILTRP